MGCCDDRQPLTSVEEGLEILLNGIKPQCTTEIVGLSESLGRILAENLKSGVDVPPLDNSGMDGYAVCVEDLSPDTETTLPVSQRIAAGEVGQTLQSGTAARIFTGAPVPPGANAVVMQEQCKRNGDMVTLPAAVSLNEHIRSSGEDLRKGDSVLEPGTLIRAQEIGVIASIGRSSITVFTRPRVCVLSTGDELMEPGERPQHARIYNSNRYTLIALLTQLGCEVEDTGIVGDTPEAVRDVMKQCAPRSDLVISTGGVSVGEEDHVRDVVTELGSLHLWRLALKPGKPLAFGYIGDTPFLGLPGNPVSAFVTFCLFGAPALRKMQGRTKILPNKFRVKSNFTYRAPKRREYLRARIDDESGETILSIYENQGSGVLSSTTWAEGLAVVEVDCETKMGDMIDYLPFSELLR